LAVLPDRRNATGVPWLKTTPAARRAQMTTVCTAMWEGDRRAVAEVRPNAAIVIARFHGAQHDRAAVDQLRKQAVRRRKKELPTATADDRKQTRWPCRKRSTDVEAAEQVRLDARLAYRPARPHASPLREELTTICDTARSKADGLRRIRAWRQRVEKSGLACFAAFLKLLDTWRDGSTKYCIDHQTRGFVEGLNNKRKVRKRRCDGMRNVGRLFQRLTLDLEGYRRFSPWRTTAPRWSGVHGKS
jgi:transposase